MLVIIAIATEHSLSSVQNWFIASLGEKVMHAHSLGASCRKGRDVKRPLSKMGCSADTLGASCRKGHSDNHFLSKMGCSADTLGASCQKGHSGKHSLSKMGCSLRTLSASSQKGRDLERPLSKMGCIGCQPFALKILLIALFRYFMR